MIDKDTFLNQSLEEMDGFDGVLLPQDFYNFIVQRDGSCPYSVDELEAWLKESEPTPWKAIMEDLFKQDDFRTQYELAKSQGDKRFGSECKHVETKNGYCTQCLRRVVTTPRKVRR